MTDIVKGGVLTLVPELDEHGAQHGFCIRVEKKPPSLAPKEKLIGIAGVKILTPVGFTGSQTVTEHLRHIFFGHLHADDAGTVGIVVGPELKVMAVAALMMHPGGTVAELIALHVVGTAVALIIADTGNEFRRRVFRQVMSQSLPVQSQTETVFPYQSPMTVDGFQMAQNIHEFHLAVPFNKISIPRANEKNERNFCEERFYESWIWRDKKKELLRMSQI